ATQPEPAPTSTMTGLHSDSLSSCSLLRNQLILRLVYAGQAGLSHVSQVSSHRGAVFFISLYMLRGACFVYCRPRVDKINCPVPFMGGVYTDIVTSSIPAGVEIATKLATQQRIGRQSGQFNASQPWHLHKKKFLAAIPVGI